MLWVKNKNKIKHINNKCCEFLQKHLIDDAEVVTEDALLSKVATHDKIWTQDVVRGRSYKVAWDYKTAKMLLQVHDAIKQLTL
jgi:hypothetical protein